MASANAKPLLAVDIGNSRIKLGLFPPGSSGGPRFTSSSKPQGMFASTSSLPVPKSTLSLSSQDWSPAELKAWLAKHVPRDADWRIGSVFRAAATQLLEWIQQNRQHDPTQLLSGSELPLSIDVESPSTVGIDRLLAAVAVNRLREANAPAVIVDLGSAITVDLVSEQGEFRGGAILPGIGMSARALCEQTDVLPHLPLTELDAPPAPLGRSTQAAIESGLFWGAVGAVRELTTRLAAQCSSEPEVFLTGGAAPSVAKLLGPNAHFQPHLVLAGIVLSS